MHIVGHVHNFCFLSQNLIATKLLKTKRRGLLLYVLSGKRWSLRSVSCDTCCTDNAQKFKSLSVFCLGVCCVCRHMLIESVIRANKMRESCIGVRHTLSFPEPHREKNKRHWQVILEAERLTHTEQSDILNMPGAFEYPVQINTDAVGLRTAANVQLLHSWCRTNTSSISRSTCCDKSISG